MSAVCFECGEPADHDHHVVPRSLGGTKTVPLCVKCHALVHSRESMSHSALTTNALRAKKARGERTGGIPFGFAVDPTDPAKLRLIPVPASQAALVMIREMHKAGESLRAIAAALDAHGVPPQSGGARWYASSVQSVLRTVDRAEG